MKESEKKINLDERESLNVRIDEINQLHQTQIAFLPEWWNQIQLVELKNWGKILRKKACEEESKKKEREIREKIE